MFIIVPVTGTCSYKKVKNAEDLSTDKVNWWMFINTCSKLVSMTRA